MLELGAHSDRAARRVRRAAAAVGLDLLIAVGGPPARALADAAVAARAWRRRSSPTSRPAPRPRSSPPARTRPGDLVLVKGSRGIGTDLVVDRLKAEFA